MAQILEKLEEKRKRLEELENYDLVKQETQRQWKECEERLDTLCGKLSDARQKEGKKLVKRISQGLKDLNFMDVQFSMEFRRLSQYGLPAASCPGLCWPSRRFWRTRTTSQP